MKNRLLWLLYSILFLMLLAPVPVQSQNLETFEREKFIQDKDTLLYRILYPKNFDKNEKYPLVLFLHGAGERGDDNNAQLANGAQLFLEKIEEFPAVVIFPQAPKDDYWAKVDVDRNVSPFTFNFKNMEEPTKALKKVMVLVDSLTSESYIDRDRIYVGGLSMGAMGTYELISRKPNTFAAAFAICGGADPAIVQNYPPGFNIWIFHGEKG